MLHIMGKSINLGQSPSLFQVDFNHDPQLAQWIVYGGQWWVEDGWLTGKNPDNAPGMIVSRNDYPGNVLLDFEARTVLPCTHDIDIMWNGSWDETTNQRGTAYVAGVEGWWEGKVGIEKSPDYRLTVCTPLFDFTPGDIYRIQCGSIDGHCFIFVNGRLALEVTDPDPIDAQQFARIGFEAYCSHIQVRNLSVRSIIWKRVYRHYTPEFE